MKTATFLAATALVFAALLAPSSGQRITTIQLDGVQYFISRMNPYSPELNFFLAYQYCRSLGLQLTSFETKEKADAMTAYLRNAGHHKYDFWTSGNKLGTDMHLWMSTGLPFNATFDYMNQAPNVDGVTIHPEESVLEEEENEARSADSAHHSCVVLKAPDHRWATDDCAAVKDFICEQTRCYYYNYGSIPVSTAQGSPKPHATPVKLPPTEARVPPKPLSTTSTPAPTTTTTTSATTPEVTTPLTAPPLLNITVKRGANLRAQPTPPVLVQFSVPARQRIHEEPLPTRQRLGEDSFPARQRLSEESFPPRQRLSEEPVPARQRLSDEPMLATTEVKFSVPSRHRVIEEPAEAKQAFVGADHAKHTPRNIEGKTGAGNVVYVKAIGAKNGVAGWSLAYVGKDNGRAEEVPEYEAANKRKNPDLAE